MGRNKLDKTSTEMVAQRQKWAEVRNKRRRDNYASDSEYRAVVNERNRDSYRTKNNVILRNCGENINRLAEFGSVRKIALDGYVYEQLTFTVKELAQAMGDYHPIVLYRWHKENKFPRPEVEMVKESGVIRPNMLVYTEDQARRLLTILSAHQSVKQYLHNTDTETIRSLFAVMEEKAVV